MKQTQWAVALCVLAALVFVITFAMNYLGGTGGSHGGTGPVDEARELTFISKIAPLPLESRPTGDLSPEDSARVLECEEKKPSFQDFWFRNDNDQPVRVGLDAKNCTCSGVAIAILPEKAREQLLGATASWPRLGWQGPIWLIGPMAVALEVVQKQALLKEMMDRADAVEVPPQGVGFVRLRWTRKETGTKTLQAALWMGEKGSLRSASLAAQIQFHEAMRAARSSIDGLVLTDADLGRGKTVEIVCWSATRPHFQLAARLLDPRGGSPAGDPVCVGAPEPIDLHKGKVIGPQGKLFDLDQQNLQALRQAQPLSAYRVLVSLQSVAADGKTPFDLGRFRRLVELSSPDEGIDSLTVTISGRVRGVVELAENEELVVFGAFKSRAGKHLNVTLQSAVPGLKLEFDRTRTPDWLSAQLSAPHTAEGNRQTWTMRAEVRPEKAVGPFPRRDERTYADSAIYLKATVPGQTPRPVRIEVHGSATQG
jgi:hypothetical protein